MRHLRSTIGYSVFAILLCALIAGCPHKQPFNPNYPRTVDLKPKSWRFVQVLKQATREVPLRLTVKTDGTSVDVYVMSKYGPGGTKPAELDAIGKQILESNKAPADIWAGKEDVVEDTLQFVKPEGHSIAAILLINRSEARVKVELDLVEKEQ